MLTVRSSRLATLGVAPGSLVLDAGAGFGRHAFELARQGARVVALDYAADEVSGTKDTFAAMVDAGEIPAERYVGVLRGDATRLPFATDSFDADEIARVEEPSQGSEHVPAQLLNSDARGKGSFSDMQYNTRTGQIDKLTNFRAEGHR